MKTERDAIIADAAKLRKRGLAWLDAITASFAGILAPTEEKRQLDYKCRLAEQKYRVSVAADKVLQNTGIVDG